MTSELEIRRLRHGYFSVADTEDPDFTLNDISEMQLLDFLHHRKLVGTTPEAVLKEFDSNEKRSAVHVVIDRSL